MSIYKALRFFLFFFSPDMAHDITLKSLKLLDTLCLLKTKSASHESDFYLYKGLKFKNRIGLAAGLDKNGDYIKPLSKLGFGFIEVGTVTPKPQNGNPKPRLFRLKNNKGIINRLGFNNKGVDYLVEKIKNLRNRNFILGINIGKNKDSQDSQAVDDYLYCMEKCYLYADYITINISSPNTPGLRDFQSKEKMGDLIDKIKFAHANLEKKYNKKVLIFVKIASDLSLSEVKDICLVCVDKDIDGLILTNTTINKSVLTFLDKNMDEKGGISGAPLFDLSTQILQEFNSTLQKEFNKDILLIGVGGIDSPQKALAKIENGARLVQIYSGLIYEGPGLIDNILKEMRKFFSNR